MKEWLYYVEMGEESEVVKGVCGGVEMWKS